VLAGAGSSGRLAEPDKPVLMARGLDESSGEGAILDAFTPFGQVKEIRLVKDRVTKVSRGFAFVEFHSVEHAKAAADSSEPILVDGCVVRVSFAQHVKDGGGSRGGGGGAPGEGGGSGNSGYEFALDHTSASGHQGPKRSGFGIPYGFLPDASSGLYYSAESGYYYDADKKL
jgi:RNA recognition motif-containing protein